MIKVVYKREYSDGLRQDRVSEFQTLRAARRFILALSPYRTRTDIHGNRVKDSHAKLVN